MKEELYSECDGILFTLREYPVVYENVEVAKEFAMPYIMLRNPKPYDTTTLNYEWQVWGTQAFFDLYTGNRSG